MEGGIIVAVMFVFFFLAGFYIGMKSGIRIVGNLKEEVEGFKEEVKNEIRKIK